MLCWRNVLSFINSICTELLQKIIQIESQIQQKKKNNIKVTWNTCCGSEWGPIL